jgi:leader peptidase (prepilin peptidase)/N-methyltransferase
MTAVLFVLVFLHYGVSLATLKWTLFDCALTVLFWTDLEARLLIDEVTLGGLAAGLLLAFLVPMPVFFGLWLPQLSPVWSSFAESALTALCLSGLLLLARTAFRLLRGKEGLGLGDVKLVAMLGAFVGLQGAVWILMTATLGGTILGLLFILLTRKDFAAYELPFGSFLCFAAAAWSLWR